MKTLIPLILYAIGSICFLCGSLLSLFWDAQQIDLESRMVEILPAALQTRYIESRKQ